MTRTQSARGRAVRATALAALTIAAIAGVPGVARADGYRDDRLGFSVTPPDKWKQMPVSADEPGKVAEWQSPHEFDDADAKTKSWTRQTPRLDVVVIPIASARPAGAEPPKPDDKAVPRQPAPWRDLREYMDKAAQQAGWSNYSFSREEESRFGTVRVTVYEITVDKFTSNSNNSPRRIYGWAFYADDAIYGVVGEALIRYEDKVRPDLEAAAKTFRLFARTGPLPGAGAASASGGDAAGKDAPKKECLTDDVLRKRRADSFSQQLAKIKASLPDGWKIKESENFTAVTHCDDRYTKEVLDHAEALRAWLDENLGFVGGGYAGNVVLRVCADDNERAAVMGSPGWSPERCEVVTGQDRRGWSDNRRSELNVAIYAIWLRDKNRLLSECLPPWLESGLPACVGSAVSKGRVIADFKATTRDNVDMANLRRAGKLLDGHAFVTMDWEAMRNDAESRRQSEAFVRFLLTGGGHANPEYRNVLSDYIKSVAILLDECSDAVPVAPGAEPKNEEEDAARRHAIADAWKRAEKEMKKRLAERTFPGWDDAAWKTFNAAYVKELGG